MLDRSCHVVHSFRNNFFTNILHIFLSRDNILKHLKYLEAVKIKRGIIIDLQNLKENALYLFYLFCLFIYSKAIIGCAQDTLLALHSGFSPGKF